jgi:hypothetical protein
MAGNILNRMAEISANPVATPILDSTVLPKKRRKNSFGAMAFGLLVGILFSGALIVATTRAQAAHSPAIHFMITPYFLALLLVVVVHELGHLLAGWMVGFRFNSITIGPISIYLEYGRLKVRVRRSLPAGGSAGMHVDRVFRLRRRLLIFTAGGPLANLLSGAVTLLFLSYVPMTGTWFSTLADLFWMISVILGVGNLLPFRLGALYPDGARIWMFLSSRAKSRRRITTAAIASQSQAGVRPRQFRRTWLQAASSVQDGSVDEFAGNWTAYIAASDRKDTSVAAFHLERCLALVSLLGPSLRDLVALEAAVFMAWSRKDVPTAQKWLEQVKRRKALPQLMQMRAEIALHCARKEFAQALSRWQDGFAFIEKLPQTPVKKNLLEGFLEWREEIVERQHSKLTLSEPALSLQSSGA